MRQQAVGCHVRDPRLAGAGERLIDRAGRGVPALLELRRRFERERPLEGLRVSAFLPVTAETANLVVALRAGGADVVSAVFRSTLQQTTIPDALRGRLAAFNIFVVAGGPRLGDFEGGVVASIFTPAVSVVSGGLLCLAGVVVIAAAVPQFARWRVGDPP